PTPLPQGRGVGVRGPGVSVNHTPSAPKATPPRDFLQAHRGGRPLDPAGVSRVARSEKGRAAADLGEDRGRRSSTQYGVPSTQYPVDRSQHAVQCLLRRRECFTVQPTVIISPSVLCTGYCVLGTPYCLLSRLLRGCRIVQVCRICGRFFHRDERGIRTAHIHI